MNVMSRPTSATLLMKPSIVSAAHLFWTQRSNLKGHVGSFSFRNFNQSKQFQLDPVNIDQHTNLFNFSVDGCTIGGVGVSAGVSMDIDAAASAQVTLGFVFAGSIIPPTISQAVITAGA
jgi:hypothetical protein